ncbi:mannose-6-phosphate isomerase, class I [Agromyces sp. MMS24-K17]|uniref:mannose-6-phosphate isomerase, class I n=1 Tax=Agromyces sp. MMS24-K17 TaxID=3372850 RepID=UPI003754BF0D
MPTRTAQFTTIENDPRPYAWGTIDGVARVLGLPGSGGPEAELWLGSHPSSPSRAAEPSDWADLAEWETGTGRRLPFLLKVLCADSPLSLQAHPTPEQARAGYDREDALGVPLDASDRNYRDRNAKPELIVALSDGFEALCGFRPVPETLAAIDLLGAVDPLAPIGLPGATAGAGEAARLRWRELLAGPDGVRRSLEWLLSGDPEVTALVASVTAAAAADPERFELANRLAAAYPGDPGILVALMLNHVTLRAGESLWLPAGNIHAYLRGDGVELMGPSDNVLRGGLTPKHVDTAELARVLDFGTGPASKLVPVDLAPGVVSYRPRAVPSGRGVPFELIAVGGDAVLDLPGAAIAVVTDGAFALSSDGSSIDVPRGRAVFVADAGRVRVSGAGRLFVATAPGAPTN